MSDFGEIQLSNMELGVWGSGETHPGRLEHEFPKVLQELIVSSLSRQVNSGDYAPVLLQIGPGSGNETRSLFRMIPEGVRVVAVEHDSTTALRLRNQPDLPKFPIFHVVRSNGFKVFSEMPSKMTSEVGRVGLAIAVNSLAIAVNYMLEKDASELIDDFLTDAKEMMRVGGVIVLGAGTAGLGITVTERESGDRGFMVLPEHYIESEFLKVRPNGSTASCRSEMWKRWMEALKSRDDFHHESDLSPEYNDNITNFDFSRHGEWHYIRE